MFGTLYLLVAGFGRFVGSLYIIVLLTGDGILCQQFLVTLQFPFGISS